MLASDKVFGGRGLGIKAAFDNDLSKIGKVWQGVKIEDVEKIRQILFEQEIKMGIIATPAQAAQAVASMLIEGGGMAFMIFALAAPNSIAFAQIITLISPILIYHKLQWFILDVSAEVIQEDMSCAFIVARKRARGMRRDYDIRHFP